MIAPNQIDAVDSGGAERNLNRMRSHQVSALSGNGVAGAISGIAGSIILAAMLIGIEQISTPLVLVWLAGLLAAYFCQILICLRHRRDLDSDYRPWAFRFIAVALAEGVIWGAGVVAIAAAGTDKTELLMLVMSTGVAAGSALTFGSLLPAFHARFLPTTLPYALWSLWRADVLHLALALLTVVFTIAILQLVRQYNRTLIEMLRLRFENVDLVGELRLQTDAANLANTTKSRFLASASHDLRQPVHALGLFVGALQGHQMDAGAQRLVRQIDGSIESLDNLFVSLLDVSKLDAGVMQFRPQDFKLQPLLERVCRDHEAEAKAKGLRLVLHPCSLGVRSDPMLLERVVRNLVSNAVRYTAHGRVVIGCRRGAQVSIQVLDTGPGIAEEEREQIFQEFYQLDNPERDRGKGLGLGLAIVKRLTDLLGSELTFQSRVDAGSVFKVTVALANDVPPEVDIADTTPSRNAVGGLVLVLDDETAIQEAMRSLLTGWGHQVVTAGSGDEMLELIAASSAQPSLIVCDYRLRGDENGIAVIRRLQSEYNSDIPALLITGDTAPDRLKEATESGLPLLHKPIHNSRLRAVIGELLDGPAQIQPLVAQ